MVLGLASDVLMARHGLPDAYPFDRPDFNETQAQKARWVVYKGVSDGSEWHLADGTLLEIWPGGFIFDEHGTVVGRLEQVGFGERPGAANSQARPAE